MPTWSGFAFILPCFAQRPSTLHSLATTRAWKVFASTSSIRNRGRSFVITCSRGAYEPVHIYRNRRSLGQLGAYLLIGDKHCYCSKSLIAFLIDPIFDLFSYLLCIL